MTESEQHFIFCEVFIMGLFSSLFGGKKEPKANIVVKPTVVPNRATQSQETAPIKNVESSVQDLVLLSLAEDYKVGENKYPNYFRSRFGIGFPNERFKQLEAKGLIRPSTAIEALPHLKASDIKSIATKLGIKTSGKKEELCKRIAESASEADVAGDVTDRYWILTENGKALLTENSYISFYMEKHRYDLELLGLDIGAYSKLYANKPNGRVRDILWGEFNRRTPELYKKGITKGEFRDYCELLRTMGLFLEEEGRHKDALSTYLRYLHYRINFEAGLSALKHYSFMKKVEKNAVDSSADMMFISAEILPFMADDIQTMCNGCEFDSQQLYQFMVETLSKETDTGMFPPKELADFIMFGLNGDREGQRQLCKVAMTSAVKKLPK